MALCQLSGLIALQASSTSCATPVTVPPFAFLMAMSASKQSLEMRGVIWRVSLLAWSWFGMCGQVIGGNTHVNKNKGSPLLPSDCRHHVYCA